MRVERYDIAVDRDKARVTITIDVVEGAQYRVGNIKLTGVTLVPEEEVRRQLGFKTRRRVLRARRCGTASATSPISTAPSAGPRPTSFPARISRPADDHRRLLRDRRGARGLRRAHQHHRQHAQRGQDPAPRDPLRGGRPLHPAEAAAGPPAAGQPGLLRDGERHHPARDRQEPNHRERRGHRAADRHLLHRRRLLLGRQLRRDPRHLPAQLPGPRLAALAAHPGRRQHASRGSSASPSRGCSTGRCRPASTSSTSSAQFTSTTTTRLAAPCG